MRRILLPAAAAAVCALALTGCVPAAPAHSTSATHAQTRTPIPTVSATPGVSEKMLDTAATSDVGVAAYSLGGYPSATDSGFAAAGRAGDAFPKGSWVAVFRLSVTGEALFSKADVTGMNFAGSTWDTSATDQAVFDDKGGAEYATTLGIPYGPAGAFGKAPWLIENGHPYNFAIAVRVPALATTLTVKVNVPSQSAPMTLTLPVGGE